MGRSTVYNTLVTGEQWIKVLEKNKGLLEEWLEYLSSIDRSPKTIVQYEADFKAFLVWNLEKNKNKFFTDLKKKDIMRFQNYLINTLGHSPARVRRMRSTLSSLSNYIERMLDEEEEFEDFRNIINKVPAPSNEPVREKTVLSDEELQEILDKLVESKEYQKACLVSLAAYSGARKAELVQFKVSYFNEENINNGLYKTPEKIRSKGRGKIGKQIEKYTIASYFNPYLKLWLQEREEKGIDNEWLFVTKDKDKWIQAKTSTLDSWIKQVEKHSDKPQYLHLYRHFFVSFLIRADIPAEVIKEIVQWASISMVSKYNDNTVDDELGKYFSNEGIIQQEEKALKDL